MSKKPNKVVTRFTKKINDLFKELNDEFDLPDKLQVAFLEIPIENLELTKEDISNGILENDIEEFSTDPEVTLISNEIEDGSRIRIFTSPEGLHVIVTPIETDDKPTTID